MGLLLWSELFDSDLQQNLSSPVFESQSQTPGGFSPIKSEEYITYLNHKNILISVLSVNLQTVVLPSFEHWLIFTHASLELVSHRTVVKDDPP